VELRRLIAYLLIIIVIMLVIGLALWRTRHDRATRRFYRGMRKKPPRPPERGEESSDRAG